VYRHARGTLEARPVPGSMRVRADRLGEPSA
jgi:hypothetical protein